LYDALRNFCMWLARSSPAIFAAALAGGCYAVLSQDVATSGGLTAPLVVGVGYITWQGL
jgi:hypothetical protein